MKSDYHLNLGEVGGIPLTASMAKIIEFLKLQTDEYHPKILAKLTRMKYSTTRRHCYTLWKKGVLARKKVDGLTFYFLPPQVQEAIQPTPHIAYHGFKLKYENAINYHVLGLTRWREKIYLKNGHNGDITIGTHMVGKTDSVELLGEVGFQHEGGTLMVSYGGSGRPLSCEEFEAFCSWLSGRYGCDVFNEWDISQVGINMDEVPVHWDRFGPAGSRGSISIKDFHGNVYRWYDKQLDNGKWVERDFEVHLKEKMKANALVEGTVSAMMGSLSNLSIVQLVAQTNQRIDELTTTLTKFMAWQMQRGGGE